MIHIKKASNREQKQKKYNEKYKDIPIDYNERLEWMVDRYKLSPDKMEQILLSRNNSITNLSYSDYLIRILLEEPEGASRPRFRVIDRKNITEFARSSSFVHIYSPHAHDDQVYMKKLTNQELDIFDGLINTPCILEYNAYLKTPSNFNIIDIFLSEIGLKRPNIIKPDWDNIGKKYCDMYNHNIWLDDSMVITGTVNKYYSILPRIEIILRYLNVVYNKYQYNMVVNRKDYDGKELHYLDNEGNIV